MVLPGFCRTGPFLPRSLDDPGRDDFVIIPVFAAFFRVIGFISIQQNDDPLRCFVAIVTAQPFQFLRFQKHGVRLLLDAFPQLGRTDRIR